MKEERNNGLSISLYDCRISGNDFVNEKNQTFSFICSGRLAGRKTKDIPDIGRTVFVSCWTDDSTESIPMWNMYSDMKSGIRIKAAKDLFEDYLVDAAGNLIISDYSHFTEKAHIFPPELRQIIYEDDESKLCPKIVEKNTWNQSEFGIYKRRAWKFQREWRYIERCWPGSEYDNLGYSAAEEYKVFANDLPKQLFLKIKSQLFETLEITLSPKISSGNRTIVKLLKKEYCPNMLIKASELENCIR